VGTTTAMPIWLVETGAQNSISWRPTPTPGTPPLINVMHQMIRVITATVTEVVTASAKHTELSHMVQEKSTHSTLFNHST